MDTQKTKERIDRRSFLHSAAGVGAGLVLSPIASGQKRRTKKPDDINMALLGAGEQGRILMNICLKILLIKKVILIRNYFLKKLTVERLFTRFQLNQKD